MGKYLFESCRPQEVGISDRWIQRFLGILKAKKICMHSMLMMHKGKVIYEAYAEPYTRESLQRLYSVSKSFTALAVGLLADDGAISLEDRIVEYFPDMVEEPCHPYLRETTIRQLLMMSGPPATGFGVVTLTRAPVESKLMVEATGSLAPAPLTGLPSGLRPSIRV